MSKKKRKLTRKQRAALARGRRLACNRLYKEKKISSSRGNSKLEREVATLEADLKSRIRREQLKEKKRSLKERRRMLRDALRGRSKEAEFLLGSSRFET